MEVGLIHEFLFWGFSWVCLYIGFSYLFRKNKKLPPGPSGWPVLGCLPLLGSMPHVALTELSRKYGPIVYLKMGTSKMVVANTPAAATAFLKTLDINFSNRTSDFTSTFFSYNMQDMGWAPYGDRWKMFRKLCNIHMMGGKALDDWQPVREAETGRMLKSIFVQSCNNQTVNVLDLLSICITNIFGQIILSKRVFEGQGDEANQFKDNIVELLAIVGQFNIGDFIPSIAWMDLNRVQGSMKKIAKRFDDTLNKMIAEHQATANKRATPDFLDVLMSKQKNFDRKEERLSDDNIKGLLLDLFTGGTDTSSIVIEWALSELILNPKLLKHAQAEMDEVIGKDRHFQVSDIPKLPYLVAICKEVFRKHPPTPLGLPRVSTKACQVGGYYIPKGTRFTLNIWGIGRDPEIWDNPLEFNPNRFIGSKIDPSGGDFRFIPFGAGRRMCPGTRMGIAIVEYNLGSLIHAFDWELPPGKNNLSMEETFGLALPKKEPLMARATPRLALHLY